MKAEQFGAWADQLRYRASWQPKKIHKQALCCGDCDFFQDKSEVGTKNWCSRSGFQTTKTALCPLQMIEGRRSHHLKS